MRTCRLLLCVLACGAMPGLARAESAPAPAGAPGEGPATGGASGEEQGGGASLAIGTSAAPGAATPAPRPSATAASSPPTWGPPLAQRAPVAGTPGRFGLRSRGLSLELPMVGVLSVVGTTRTSYGYTLGAGLSWEAVPGLLVRGYGSFGKSFGASAGITWIGPTGAQSRRQDASYWGAELGGGVAYVFKQPGRDWEPFVGADVAASLAGYQYTFQAADPLTRQDLSAPPPPGTSPDVHEALEWGWLTTVRVGVRLAMLRWLGTQLDLGLSYWPSPTHPVSNTYTSLGVSSTSEGEWLVRSTFSVRLGV